MIDLFKDNYDFSDCLSNCTNNGLCMYSNVGLKFICTCNLYYSGPYCSTDLRPCSSSPCMNNGTCIQNITDLSNPSFYCDCGLYYEGEVCETKKDVCKNETCSNHGKCKDINNKPKCECLNLYLGENCEITSEALKIIQKTITTTSIIAIIIICCFYLLIITMDLSRIFSSRNSNFNPKKRQIIRFRYIA